MSTSGTQTGHGFALRPHGGIAAGIAVEAPRVNQRCSHAIPSSICWPWHCWRWSSSWPWPWPPTIRPIPPANSSILAHDHRQRLRSMGRLGRSWNVQRVGPGRLLCRCLARRARFQTPHAALDHRAFGPHRRLAPLPVGAGDPGRTGARRLFARTGDRRRRLRRRSRPWAAAGPLRQCRGLHPGEQRDRRRPAAVHRLRAAAHPGPGAGRPGEERGPRAGSLDAQVARGRSGVDENLAKRQAAEGQERSGWAGGSG